MSEQLQQQQTQKFNPVKQTTGKCDSHYYASP